MKPMTQLFLVVALGAASLAFADDIAKPVRQYVGVAKCKTCHNSAKKGAQYKVWSESKHSHAFLELGTPKALEIAAKHEGVKDPQTSPECLQCHVTGFGEPSDHFAASLSESLGVQCESCHGPGSAYFPRHTMLEIRSKQAKPEQYGLVMPTKETCAKCHNEKSPSGKFVDWPADSAKIAHPIPPGAESKAGEETKE
jgi:cytochrome c554/c'-like protein